MPLTIIVASDMEDVIANLLETIHPDLTEQRKQEELPTCPLFLMA